MQFKPVLCKKILAGRKTMTRRIIGDGKDPYVGQKFSIQPGMARKGIATAEVTRVRKERLSKMSHIDARSEGFEDVADFMDYWGGLYGRESDPHVLVWVIEFKLIAVTAVICKCCGGSGTQAPR